MWQTRLRKECQELCVTYICKKRQNNKCLSKEYQKCCLLIYENHIEKAEYVLILFCTAKKHSGQILALESIYSF